MQYFGDRTSGDDMMGDGKDPRRSGVLSFTPPFSLKIAAYNINGLPYSIYSLLRQYLTSTFVEATACFVALWYTAIHNTRKYNHTDFTQLISF